MSQIIVGISDQNTAIPPDSLITYALGSCVGICLYDSANRVAGLSHILLPEAFRDSPEAENVKFADRAIEVLVGSMEKLGSLRYRLTAKIAGGANMFATSGISIGDRNVETVKSELERLRIKLVAEDTGADYGRTVVFDPQNGLMTVKSIGRESKVF
jgi:chemotaxis protein CheD